MITSISQYITKNSIKNSCLLYSAFATKKIVDNIIPTNTLIMILKTNSGKFSVHGIKFRYSEKATKISFIFHFLFDIT